MATMSTAKGTSLILLLACVVVLAACTTTTATSDTLTATTSATTTKQKTAFSTTTRTGEARAVTAAASTLTVDDSPSTAEMTMGNVRPDTNSLPTPANETNGRWWWGGWGWKGYYGGATTGPRLHPMNIFDVSSTVMYSG